MPFLVNDTWTTIIINCHELSPETLTNQTKPNQYNPNPSSSFRKETHKYFQHYIISYHIVSPYSIPVYYAFRSHAHHKMNGCVDGGFFRKTANSAIKSSFFSPILLLVGIHCFLSRYAIRLRCFLFGLSNGPNSFCGFYHDWISLLVGWDCMRQRLAR